MKIILLAENTTTKNLKTAHGLSIYIETEKHKILFDVGPDDTLFENANTLDINLKEIDTVIISHGHSDHGGALKQFLDINSHAQIFIQEKAFLNYYSRTPGVVKYIGLDQSLRNNPRITLLNGDFTIDEELSIITVKNRKYPILESNDNLYLDEDKDNFEHEQNLLVNNALFIGCGHNGLINICDAINTQFNYVIGGFHTFSPAKGTTVCEQNLNDLSKYMESKNVEFYTCHCTGCEALNYFKNINKNVTRLGTGDIIEL